MSLRELRIRQTEKQPKHDEVTWVEFSIYGREKLPRSGSPVNVQIVRIPNQSDHNHYFRRSTLFPKALPICVTFPSHMYGQRKTAYSFQGSLAHMRKSIPVASVSLNNLFHVVSQRIVWYCTRYFTLTWWGSIHEWKPRIHSPAHSWARQGYRLGRVLVLTWRSRPYSSGRRKIQMGEIRNKTRSNKIK
jgi:hypothetical protein